MVLVSFYSRLTSKIGCILQLMNIIYFALFISPLYRPSYSNLLLFLYAIGKLKAHGFSSSSIHNKTKATTTPKLLHAAPSQSNEYTTIQKYCMPLYRMQGINLIYLFFQAPELKNSTFTHQQ